MEDQAARDVIAVARRAPHSLGYAGPAPRQLPPARSDAEDHGLAVASVVCGLLFFVPFIPGLMSLSFGLGVLRRGRRLALGDFLLAIVGTVFGAFNLGLSAVLLAAHAFD